MQGRMGLHTQRCRAKQNDRGTRLSSEVVAWDGHCFCALRAGSPLGPRSECKDAWDYILSYDVQNSMPGAARVSSEAVAGGNTGFAHVVQVSLLALCLETASQTPSCDLALQLSRIMGLHCGAPFFVLMQLATAHGASRLCGLSSFLGPGKSWRAEA